jgi:hypothetical protein
VDQVVLDMDDPVMSLGQPHHSPPQQRRLEGVQRRPRLFHQQFRECALCIGFAAEIDIVHPGDAVLVNPLRGILSGPGDEFQPESGLAFDRGGERVVQYGHIQDAVQVERGREVVGSATSSSCSHTTSCEAESLNIDYLSDRRREVPDSPWANVEPG